MNRLHSWQLTIREAIALQTKLAQQVSCAGDVVNPRFIAGADISVNRFQNTATAAIVVMDFPTLELVEVKVVRGKPGMPYIPGLLSFREAPLLLGAFSQLEITPDLILIDGQGIAHPRRLGIASHLGLWLDVPAIGCAKSRLCGDCAEPPAAAGSYTEITDDNEVIGAVLRTRTVVKPMYISPGHKISLESAIQIVLQCCRGYRLPEPTRLAHMAAGGNLRAAQHVLAEVK
ncbi:MAG: deoxyribonuclease V [Dehalococcoidales bacterium]|nr:deoxyribonuclease V [Dehalococcoidales bacterium]